MSASLSYIFSTLHSVSTLKKRDHYQAALLGNSEISTHHSWRLCVLILLVLTEISLDINTERALSLALIHDLNFLNSPIFESGEKKIDEEILNKNLSHTFDPSAFFREYEEQVTDESRFVRALDILEPFIRLNESGTDLYIPQVFHENYFDAVFDAIAQSAQIYRPIVPFLESFQEQVERKYDHPEETWKEIIL